MPAPKTPKDFDGRDRALLRHASDYGVVLQAVVSVLYFAGKQCGHVIRRFAEVGDLELFPRALPGNVSYARLTKSGCARIGVSEKQARPISGHALSQAIAIAVFCVLGQFRRVRVTHRDLLALFGDQAPHANLAHVLVSKAELGHYALLRVVFAAGSIQETKKQLSRLIEESQTNPRLADAMRGLASYGFLLLCPTETQKNALRDALTRSDLFRDALVLVEVGPGVEELPAFLKNLKRTRS